MNVNLPPRFEALVRSKVASGLYTDPSEVVCEALRLLVEQDQLRTAHLADLRMSLATGVHEADQGELLDGPGVVLEMRELRKRPVDPICSMRVWRAFWRPCQDSPTSGSQRSARI